MCGTIRPRDRRGGYFGSILLQRMCSLSRHRQTTEVMIKECPILHVACKSPLDR
jgi:hypothetical protein